MLHLDTWRLLGEVCERQGRMRIDEHLGRDSYTIRSPLGGSLLRQTVIEDWSCSMMMHFKVAAEKDLQASSG
jgi:hypothetical protein